MSGETPEKTIDQSTPIEKSENPSSNKQTETSLVNLNVNVETSALKDNINNDKNNPDVSTNNTNITSNNPNIPTNNPENQEEDLALRRQLEMLNHIKILLKGYESLKTGINTSEGNKQTKKQLIHRLDENIENLNNMWKDLGGDKESLKDPKEDVTELKENSHIYTDLSTYRGRIGQLQDWFDNYEQVRQIIVLGGRTSDIPAIIDSIQDAKKSKRYEKQDNKYQKKINKILHDPAITSLRNKDLERYEEYLEAVINGEVEPSSHPFYKAHCKSFMMIQSANPSLYQILAPSKGRKVPQHETQHVVRIVEGVPATVAIRTSDQPESLNSRLGKSFIEDIISPLAPSIENNARQKKAWEDAAGWAALGGAIYMGVKAIQNVFSDKETNPKKRGKAAGWTAGLIALMNGDKIVKGGKRRVQDAFNLHPAEKIKTSAEIFQTYGFTNPEAQRMAVMHVEAPIATLSALHFIPIYELNNQRIIEYKNNQFKFNYDNYQRYIDIYNDWTDEEKRTVLAAGENLRNNDSLNDGLNALGVYSQAELDRIANGDKEKTLADEPNIYKRYLECTKGIKSGVNKELYERGLKAKDVESARKIIQEYDEKNGKDIDKLIEKWKEEGLLEVATDCPMVRLLSDLGIKIEDPDEINKTEERLKGIQEGMKYFAPGVQPYKPYSIEGNKLMFTNVNGEKITIPDGVEEKDKKFPPNLQNRTLNDYPAVILNNQEKFLEFMNDPNNHMRGKEVSSRSA